MEENDEEADQAEQGAGHRKASIADSRAFIAMKESENQTNALTYTDRSDKPIFSHMCVCTM